VPADPLPLMEQDPAALSLLNKICNSILSRMMKFDKNLCINCIEQEIWIIFK